MFGIGGFELFLILLFAFLIFGPDKLPAVAKTIGKGIAKFRAAQQDMDEVLKETKPFDPNADEPFKDPSETIDKLASTMEKHVRSAASDATSSVKAKTHEGASKNASSVKQTAKPASAPQPSAPASKPAASTPASMKNESFTERKARYERERAAKLAAEKAEKEAVEQAQQKSANDAASDIASAVQSEASVADAASAEGGEQ